MEQYILGFPNREVEEGFVKRLMRSFIDFNATNTPFNVASFVKIGMNFSKETRNIEKWIIE